MRKLASWLLLFAVCPAAQGSLIFDPPSPLGPTVNSRDLDAQPIISRDGLRLFFASTRNGGQGRRDIWLSQRANIADSFGTPVNLGSIVNARADDDPGTESPDGLRFYYSQGIHLAVASRVSLATSWAGDTVVVSTDAFVNLHRPNGEFHPAVSADELTLIYQKNSVGPGDNHDLMLSTRSSVFDIWEEPIALANINSVFGEVHPNLSADELSLFFSSDRPGGAGDYDLYRATRSSTNAPWTDPSVTVEHLTGSGINTSALEVGPFVFRDSLYFSSIRSS